MMQSHDKWVLAAILAVATFGCTRSPGGIILWSQVCTEIRATAVSVP